jgi:signal transduction histidine kinase
VWGQCNVLGIALVLLLCVRGAGAEKLNGPEWSSSPLEIQSVTVSGAIRKWRPGQDLKLWSAPEQIVFNFGPATGSGWHPIRLRYRLQGLDPSWQEGAASMCLTVRFCDEHGDQVSQETFEAAGESAGWTGSLTNIVLAHRRESVPVLAGASRVWVTVSSGCGPPATVGTYLVADLTVSKVASGTAQSEVLLHPLFGTGLAEMPADWVRDGIRPSMAKVLSYGSDPEVRALAIVDDDDGAHAEWHNVRQTAPRVAPGDRLVLEWNEAFSIGLGGNSRSASYSKLPPGNFRFYVQEVSALGVPTGIEASLVLHVPTPFRETPLFWPIVVIGALAVSLLVIRYISWYRVRGEVALLRQQRELEQDRVRIAQDIHDDLGARVTQIALLSAMAQGNTDLPQNARAEFNTISRMTRELISALYETVWAVNPENDNLDALGNYLCQMINELCTQAHLRCRFEIADLPRSLQVSSQSRHNIIMATKEAVHNTIKHAKATELTVRVGFDSPTLTINVQDNGVGFDESAQPAGSGLSNMRRRLADLHGRCRIVSSSKGTTVSLSLQLNAPCGGRPHRSIPPRFES